MDLYYRINVIHLELPPLRERAEDVPLLVNHFIARFSALKGKDISGIAPEAVAVLMGHDYPGSVRELENIIEHAFVLCPGGIIQTNHLPHPLRPRAVPSPGGTIQLMDRYERELILTALQSNQWNRGRAAKELGMHRTTLHRKIRKLGITAPDKDGRAEM